MTNAVGRHVVHLSSVHRAQDTRILHHECRSLAEAGFCVTLIANAESDFDQFGVHIKALPVLSGGRFKRMTRQVFTVWRMAREEAGDLYQIHDPELIPVGLAFRLLGKPVVYDVHESTSFQIRHKEWIPAVLRPIVAGAFRLLELLIGRLFSAIVIAEPTIGQFFPPNRTVLVQNFPLLKEFESLTDIPMEEREELVVYVGGITRQRGLLEMAEAMSLLPHDRQVRLVLAGPFSPPDLANEVASFAAAARIDVVGVLGRSEVADLLGRARVGLVVLHGVPNNLEAQPIKLFEYMAAGLPVVASDFPYWEHFVDNIGSGLRVDPTDASAIAKAIMMLLDDPVLAQQMGERGSKAVRESFNWSTESTKLVELVDRLMLQNSNPR